MIFKFEISKGNGKGESGYIVADMLLEKAMQFANVICTYACDPKTKLKAGSKYIYGSFMQTLLDQTYTSKVISIIYAHILNPTYIVVMANKLQRHLNKKIYFSREEFQLMVEQALDDTVIHGCKITLQWLAILGLAFIIGLRPGSLGPSEKLYEEQEKVGHSQKPFAFFCWPSVSSVSQVEVLQDKPMSWRVWITIRNFKVNRTHTSRIEA